MPSAAAAAKPRFRPAILSNRLGSAHLAWLAAIAKFDWAGVCETDFNAKRPTRPATRHPLPFSINSHRSQTWPPFSKQVLCKSCRRLDMRPPPFANCPLQLQEKKVRRRYASPLLDSLFSHIPLARRLYNSLPIALLAFRIFLILQNTHTQTRTYTHIGTITKTYVQTVSSTPSSTSSSNASLLRRVTPVSRSASPLPSPTSSSAPPTPRMSSASRAAASASSPR
jgi:hypothetical protein